MPWQMLDISLLLPAFALVLFRMVGLGMTAPMISSASVPTRIRGAFILAMSFMIFPLVAKQAPAEITLSMVVVGGLFELMIGATIGIGLSLIFTSVEVGGLLVGQQAGVALGRVYNPLQGVDTTITGQLYSIVLTLSFFIVGGHREMIRSLLDTFELIPMLSLGLNESVVVLMAELLTAAFTIAVRLAAPVLIALLMTTLAMGFLSRTMPQLNILSVGFQIRIITAIGIAALAIASADDLMLDVIWGGLDLINEYFVENAVMRQAGAT